MATQKSIQDFRKSLKRAMFLEEHEAVLFDKIPDEVIQGIFRHNFNGNAKFAERILLNQYSNVDKIDRPRLEQEKQNIHNLVAAADKITACLTSGEELLFVTDNDNDGSLAQAILIEFLKTLPAHMQRLVHIEYAQPIGAARGLTVDIINKATEERRWMPDHRFTIVTADNGINNREEQAKIQNIYPNASLIVTDHHLPDPRKVIMEDEKTLIFNPKYQPTEYFKNKNISGANTLGVLLSSVIQNVVNEEAIGTPQANGNYKLDVAQRQALENIQEIGSWANLLDYANAHMADMPVRPYIVEKAIGLRPLLNVSTSMSNLITSSFSDEDVNKVLAVAPKLDRHWLNEKLADVATLNVFARKLLGLHDRLKGHTDAFTEAEFYQELSKELAEPEFGYTSINPNYIEQMRPIIFNLSAIDNKDMFSTQILQMMVNAFEDLRRQERELLKGLREVNLLREDRRANSTILYPVDATVTKLFNRRLLGKSYNQDNNGFLLTLSSFGGVEASGSMRSLYNMTDILEGKEKIERQLGITLDFQGHEMAAGFFVRSQTSDVVTEEKLSKLNIWINDRITALKIEDSINQLPNMEVDFTSSSLINKINKAIKANLAGMWGMPAVIRFSPDKNNQVYITDPETTQQISLAEVVKKKRYGYQAIATDFHGGAFVVPVELLRSVVDSKFKKGLRLAFMDDGVFMASQVVDIEAMPKLIDLKGGRDDQEALASYYAETYKDSNFLELTREDFRQLPYFRFNRHGETEFQKLEALMIQFLDKTNRDVLAVVDTEGTGLGKAPKCFNIGGTNIVIDPKSGTTLSEKQFEDRYFRSASGKEYLLTKEQMKQGKNGALILLDEDEDLDSIQGIQGNHVVLYKASLNQALDVTERFVFAGLPSDLEQVTNKTVNANGDVVYNRSITGFAFSYLVNNKDFGITKEFEELTGIGKWMVEKHGRSAEVVDRELAEYYGNLKNADGEPAKIIFQAHNMPYDKGVMSANFQKFHALVDEHVTSDTAKLARKAKLAYDDTPVCSFEGIEGLPAKAYFYDSPFSDYSMTTFLARCAQGKGGVFPDTTSKVLLRYREESETFAIIDRKANHEMELSATLEDLAKAKVQEQLPNNAVKYSVERLSSRAMIRNIMLLNKPTAKKVALMDHEKPFRAALDFFQDNYHFDATPLQNIQNFSTSLFRNQDPTEILGSVDLANFTDRFLMENRETQAKFHDGWIYEKVLSQYEPDGKNKRVPSDVVEQVNYVTDLPNKKIRQVFDDVIEFKRHFNVHHALVHEQHNNIRQRSEDGQGLSDTAYESVLPQLLAMMKFYNPYFQSSEITADLLIDENVKGSLFQHMVGDKFNNELARDSFSMTQMLAFKRRGKTSVVRKAQDVASGKNQPTEEGFAEIKFKLPVDILPPGSALYGVPRYHLSQTEVKAIAKDLEFLAVNEQLKTAVRDAKNIDFDHAERLLMMAEANNEEAIIKRDRLLEVFESIEFSRRDELVKKTAEMMSDLFHGNFDGLPRKFRPPAEMIDLAEELGQEISKLYYKMGIEPDMEQIADFIDALREAKAEREKEDEERLRKEQEKQAKEAMGGGRRRKKAEPEEEEKELHAEVNPVRSPNFLPMLDIKRVEPMKFVLNKYGLKLFFPMLRKQMEELSQQGRLTPEENQVVRVVSKPRRRGP